MDRGELLERAGALALRSVDEGGRPFGSVVALDGRVLGEGANRVEQTGDATSHAELEAIRAACATLGSADLAGAVLASSAEPCPMCMAACYWAGIGEVLYGATRHDAAAAGFDSAGVYEELARPPAERRIPTRHRASDSALEALRQWAGEAPPATS